MNNIQKKICNKNITLISLFNKNKQKKLKNLKKELKMPEI